MEAPRAEPGQPRGEAIEHGAVGVGERRHARRLGAV